MKRFLPFLLILLVAVLAVGGGTMLYRAKKRAQPPLIVGPAPAPAKEGDSDKFHAEGPADAPVTLEIYGDFQCPACAIASQVVDELRKDYEKKMRVVFYEFPLAMHAHALEAAMVAEAAGLQQHFWPMHDMLYKYQQVWSKASDPTRFFNAYAGSMGLDLARFAADVKSNELKARIQAQGDAGVLRGVKNTPTIFINGKELRGAFDEATIKAAIDEALANKKQP